ncbi:hypothetical protein VNI00_016061 [Paramarasmius palmivorus]|uniref:Chromatin elongation factor spt5 n=1 Tax=Paramarasmius palmivorus TaxID=297713 RepID=A0AAW0BGD9_9AGAR
MAGQKRGVWNIFVDHEAVDDSSEDEDYDELASDEEATPGQATSSVVLQPPVAHLTAAQTPVLFQSIISRIVAREEAKSDSKKRTHEEMDTSSSPVPSGSIPERPVKITRPSSPRTIPPGAKSFAEIPEVHSQKPSLPVHTVEPSNDGIAPGLSTSIPPDRCDPKLPHLLHIRDRLINEETFTLGAARDELAAIVPSGSEVFEVWAKHLDLVSEAVGTDESIPSVPDITGDPPVAVPDLRPSTPNVTSSGSQLQSFQALPTDTIIFSLSGERIGYARHPMLDSNSTDVPTTFIPSNIDSNDEQRSHNLDHAPAPLPLPFQPPRALTTVPAPTDIRLDPVVNDTLEDISDQAQPLPANCGTYICKVRCKRGQEGQSVILITTACISASNARVQAYKHALAKWKESKETKPEESHPQPQKLPPIPILSAYSAGQPGWIHIELRGTYSFESPDVLDLLRAATHLLFPKSHRSRISRGPIHEIVGFQNWRRTLLPESRTYSIQVGDWVEITTGLYAGDVGLVVREEQENLSGARRVLAVVVPRFNVEAYLKEWRLSAKFAKKYKKVAVSHQSWNGDLGFGTMNTAKSKPSLPIISTPLPSISTTTTSSLPVALSSCALVDTTGSSLDPSDTPEAPVQAPTATQPTRRSRKSKSLVRPPPHPISHDELERWGCIPWVDYRFGCECDPPHNNPDFRCPHGWLQVGPLTLQYGLANVSFSVLHLKPATFFPDGLVPFFFRSRRPLVELAIAHAPPPRSWVFEVGDIVQCCTTRKVGLRSADREIEATSSELEQAFMERGSPAFYNAMKCATTWAQAVANSIRDNPGGTSRSSITAEVPVPNTWNDPFFYHSQAYLTLRRQVEQWTAAGKVPDSVVEADHAEPSLLDEVTSVGRIVDDTIIGGRIAVLPQGADDGNDRKISVLSLIKVLSIGDLVQLVNNSVADAVVIPLDNSTTDIPSTALIVSIRQSIVELRAVSGGPTYLAHANSLRRIQQLAGDNLYMPITQGSLAPLASAPANTPISKAPWKDQSVSIIRGDKKRQTGRVIDVFRDDSYASGLRILVEIQTVGAIHREPYDYGSLRHAEEVDDRLSTRTFLRLPEDPFWRLKQGYNPQYHSTEVRYFQSAHRRRHARANVVSHIQGDREATHPSLAPKTPMHRVDSDVAGTVWDPNHDIERSLHPQLKWMEDPIVRSSLQGRRFFVDIVDGITSVKDAVVGLSEDPKFVFHYAARVRTKGSANAIPAESLKPSSTPVDFDTERGLVYVVNGKYAGCFGRRVSHCFVGDNSQRKNGRLVLQRVAPLHGKDAEALLHAETITVRPWYLIRIKETREESKAGFSLLKPIRTDFAQGKRLTHVPGVPYVDSDPEEQEDATPPRPVTTSHVPKPLEGSWHGSTPKQAKSPIHDTDPLICIQPRESDPPHRTRLLRLRDDFWRDPALGMDHAMNVVNEVTLPDTPARWEWTRFFGELNEAYLEGDTLPPAPDV